MGQEQKFNFGKLKGRIVEVFGSQVAFAKALGISEITVSNKLNGRSELTSSDIRKWCKLLKINPSDIGIYFFAIEV